MTATAPEWLRAYAMLALRLNRQVTETTGATVLIYRGPDEWSAEVEAQDPPPPGRLVDDADQLLDDLPLDPPRAAYLAAQIRAMRAVARRLDGEELPLPDYARQCLGVEAEWLPESLFDAAHAQLDAALPKTNGSLADRLHAWQAAHTLAPGQMDRLPGLVERAVAETRARTNAIVPLPPDELVDCQLIPDAHFLAAGHHHGGLKSTIYINSSLPFNLADLLYVVRRQRLRRNPPGQECAVGGLAQHGLPDGRGPPRHRDRRLPVTMGTAQRGRVRPGTQLPHSTRYEPLCSRLLPRLAPGWVVAGQR